MTSALLTTPQAAAALTISRATFCRWIALRKIAVVRLGRCVRISEGEIARLIAEHTNPAVKIWKG